MQRAMMFVHQEGFFRTIVFTKDPEALELNVMDNDALVDTITLEDDELVSDFDFVESVCEEWIRENRASGVFEWNLTKEEQGDA